MSMTNEEKRIFYSKEVKAYPQYENGCLVRFDTDVAVGEVLSLKRLPFHHDLILPKDVTVVAEYPFHILVDLGSWRLSLNKETMYCGERPLEENESPRTISLWHKN